MKAEEIRIVANLGTGTMGYSTALLFAMHGRQVRMFGRSQESLDRGFASIRRAIGVYREHGLLSEGQGQESLARIEGVTEIGAACKDADFVMESVAENLEVKREVWAAVEACTSDQCIFATNTSGLSPTAISEKLARPERFVVAHFWNPPHLLPLVEVVPGKKTSPEVVRTTVALMEQIGKKPVALTREAPGFVGNRLQFALLREALHIVEEGIADPAAVDAVTRYSIGRRLGVTGPIETADLGGLDVFCNIASYLNADLDARKNASPALVKARDEGRFGAKNGKGFYDWSPERLEQIVSARESVLLDWLRRDGEQG